MKLLFGLVLMTSFIQLSFAGEKGGNGGDVLICPGSIEFFDLYETRSVYGRPVSLTSKPVTYQEKIRILADQHKLIFPNLMADLLEHTRNFENQTLFVEQELVDIPDTGDIILPQGCSIKQAIIRSKTINIPGKLYMANASYWRQMDSNSKAVAVLHEFFYGRAVDFFNHEDSRASRYINSFFVGRAPERPFYFWPNSLRALNYKFDEPWFNDDIVYIQNSYKEYLSTRITGPMQVETENLGLVTVLPGEMRLVYKGILPTMEMGSIQESLYWNWEKAAFHFSQYPILYFKG